MLILKSEDRIRRSSVFMSSTAITTVVKMMESLPIEVQEQVLEHLRDYIEDLQDEIQWDRSFQNTQEKLVAAARRAKQEIAEGYAIAMDYDQL
jgi:alpha/beta superfamily hydrolase